MAFSKGKDLLLFRRMMVQSRPLWPHIVGYFLLSLLSTPIALLLPLPLKIAVDNVVHATPLPDFLAHLLPTEIASSGTFVLGFAACLLILISLVSHLQHLGTSLLGAYTGEKLILGFRALLFRHAQRLSLSYHDTKGSSDSTYKILYDASAIQSIAMGGIIPFVTAGCTLVSMLYITFLLDRQLALVALAVSPFLFLAARLYRERLRTKWREIKKVEADAYTLVQEVLSALRVVKAFGQEEREHDRFVQQSHKGMKARINVAFAEGRLGLLHGLTIAIGTATVLFLGVQHVQAGVITLGELLLMMGYISGLYGPLETISKRIVSMQSSFASAERAYAVLDEPTDVVEKPHAKPIGRAIGVIAFHNVSFAYEEGRPVLQDVSFEVPAGTRVGIAGRTGAGKTTLVNLLTRFYDPTSGHIVLDGLDLRDYKLADLRNQFAIVLQEPVLFSTTIGENIAYARPEATEEEIIAAAKAANIHEFISSLPEGYDTAVGERGMRLSGGERQRISLARAFLKNAPILILDEPTSSVDMKTEALIMDAMERLMSHRTTFMIAHRLSTLENCDFRLELEAGRAVSFSAIPHASEATEEAAMPFSRAQGEQLDAQILDS